MPAHADPQDAAEPSSLAARQLALVVALVADGEPPYGLDADRVRMQATALLAKRARSVARHQAELETQRSRGGGARLRGLWNSASWRLARVTKRLASAHGHATR